MTLNDLTWLKNDFKCLSNGLEWLKMLKNAKKANAGQMDRPTDRPTNRRTDEVTYRVALQATKKDKTRTTELLLSLQLLPQPPLQFPPLPLLLRLPVCHHYNNHRRLTTIAAATIISAADTTTTAITSNASTTTTTSTTSQLLVPLSVCHHRSTQKKAMV